MAVPDNQVEWEAARNGHIDAFVAARVADDPDAMAAAALQLAGLQRFGGPGGRTPALLHEAYLATSDQPAVRARLAAALARSWVYSNDAARGAPFAAEAIELAEAANDPTVLADALDAQLVNCWGPDDLAERLRITARLQDLAAYVDDVRTRMDAHLWRLTTALETLDTVGVQRQLSALELLADETASSVVRFFALTRRAMHALLTDDLDRATALIDAAEPVGADAGIADAFAVQHALRAELARHNGDRDLLRLEAEVFESYAVTHGIQSLVAESAVLWIEVGDTDRARSLIPQIASSGLHTVPRDVDWMLTMTKLVEGAAGCGLVDLAREGMALLTPYAGRAAVNAGGVICVGVVEDFIWRAAVATSDPRAPEWRAAAATAYEKVGARWLLERVAAEHPSPVAAPRRSSSPDRTISFAPLAGQTVWSIGSIGEERMVPEMKGLHYLRELLRRPSADITALTLSAAVARHNVTVEDGDGGELLDRRALAAYRQRLREIDEELEEAGSWADTVKVERIEAERDALLREVASATGIHGRSRTVNGSAERARVAVRKAIAAALERIEADDPATARVLRTSIRTGGICRYDPDPDAPIEWLT